MCREPPGLRELSIFHQSPIVTGPGRPRAHGAKRINRVDGSIRLTDDAAVASPARLGLRATPARLRGHGGGDEVAQLLVGVCQQIDVAPDA